MGGGTRVMRVPGFTDSDIVVLRLAEGQGQVLETVNRRRGEGWESVFHDTLATGVRYAAGSVARLPEPGRGMREQARELVNIAAENNLVFQIGHLERFNPAVMALDNVLKEAQFIESHRIAPFNPRGADVNVILDLMIHDIDIILDFVRSPVKSIQANGVPVLSNDIDVANARIQFESGCVANVTASRVSMKSERKMRIFQPDAYITIDFQNKKLGVHRKGEGEMFPGIAEIDSLEREFEQGDALLTESAAFLKSINEKSRPVVSGEDGMRALETAIEITRLLSQ